MIESTDALAPGALGPGGGPDWARVYDLDLVYQADCWKLCGDAHCCSFTRHKTRFKILGKKPFQELPLLPGEHEFMRSQGWLAQFQDYEHKRVEVALDDRRAIHVESIVSYRAGCACDHATRPTICRLYPLFPVLDLEGRVTGIEPFFGVYEELEQLEQIARACELRSLPFDQLGIFFELISRLAVSPVHLFYLHAYRLAKRHAFDRLRDKLAAEPQSAFGLFEWQTLRERVFDKKGIRAELASLADAFEARYGERFRLPAPTSA